MWGPVLIPFIEVTCLDRHWNHLYNTADILKSTCVLGHHMPASFQLLYVDSKGYIPREHLTAIRSTWISCALPWLWSSASVNLKKKKKKTYSHATKFVLSTPFNLKCVVCCDFMCKLIGYYCNFSQRTEVTGTDFIFHSLKFCYLISKMF